MIRAKIRNTAWINLMKFSKKSPLNRVRFLLEKY